MFEDTALNEFLARFGDPDPNKSMVQNRAPVYPVGDKVESKGLADIVSFSGENDILQKNETPAVGDKKSGFMNGLMSFGTAANSLPPASAYGEGSVISGKQSDNATVDSIKDTVASATGPYGQMFRGIQKAGQGIGNAVGGDTGAVIADIFSPEESTIAVFKDEDASFGQKLLGTVPGVGALVARNLAAKRKQKEDIEKNLKLNAFEKKKREEDYMMDKGLASMGALKALREKQLGILT